MQLDVSFIVVNYNSDLHVIRLLESIVSMEELIQFEIIVVDNDISKNSLGGSGVFSDRRIKLIRNFENIGFAAAVNIALDHCIATYVCLINPDIYYIKKNSIHRIIKGELRYQKVGVVAPRLLNEDRSFQSSGEKFPTLTGLVLANIFGTRSKIVRKFFLKRKLNETGLKEHDWVTGAVFIFAHVLVKEVGKFNEKFWLYGEDLEFCFRVKEAGYSILVNNDVEFVHLKGVSSTGISTIPARINSAKGLYFFIKNTDGVFRARLSLLIMMFGLLIRFFIYKMSSKDSKDILVAFKMLFKFLLKEKKCYGKGSV
jgi:GT2 family glycosyltransferase